MRGTETMIETDNGYIDQEWLIEGDGGIIAQDRTEIIPTNGDKIEQWI